MHENSFSADAVTQQLGADGGAPMNPSTEICTSVASARARQINLRKWLMVGAKVALALMLAVLTLFGAMLVSAVLDVPD